jgi:DNA-binding protein H-NS
MATIDISSLTLGELKTLQADIEKQMKVRQQQDIARAREQIMAIASGLGVDVETLLSGVKQTKAGKVKGEKRQAMYRNPDDASQEWTGRGRKPKWLADGLEGGKQLDHYRV